MIGGFEEVLIKNYFRCYTLAEHFAELGWECFFIINKKNRVDKKFLNDCSFPLFQMDCNCVSENLTEILPCELLIIDDEELDIGFEKKARAWAKKILVFDGKPGRLHDCDFLVDISLRHIRDDYQDLVPLNSIILTGMQYHLGNNYFKRGTRSLACLKIIMSLELSSVVKEKNIELNFAEKKDAELIFLWQQEPMMRKYARNPNIPTWEEHNKWFTNCIDDFKRMLFIIKKCGLPAGVLRLDKMDPNVTKCEFLQKLLIESRLPTYEISISIPSSFQGQGIATEALELIRKIFNKINIWAEVLPGNEKSSLLFQRAGYEQIKAGRFMSRGFQC